MILAGDVGGTKTHLALFDPRPPLRLFRVETFRTGAFASLEEMLGAFLHDRDVPLAPRRSASRVLVTRAHTSCSRTRNRAPGARRVLASGGRAIEHVARAACWSSRP